MSALTHTLVALVFVAMLGACQRDAAPGRDEAAAPATQAVAPTPAIVPSASPRPGSGALSSTVGIPADIPTPDIAAGATIIYACKDASELHVAYSAHAATFALTDGRVVTLPRAESASKGGGDVYVGEMDALQRLGNVVQVEEHGGVRRECTESGGNA